MYLRQNKRPNGRIHLAICKSYRDPITKKNKQKVMKTIGYLDELYKKYPDPIKHFEKVAEDMTNKERLESETTITINHNSLLSENTNKLKNIGFAALSQIYHELRYR